MKTSELREKSVQELSKELLETVREQFNLRMQKATRQLTQTHHLGNVRKKIARLKTILQEKMG